MRELDSDDPSGVGGFRFLARLDPGGEGPRDGRSYLGIGPQGFPAAVTVLHPGDASVPATRDRFARRVDAARRLAGPRVPAVLAADPDADRPWLATAHVPGPSLERAVRARGPLPADTVAVLGRALAGTLDLLHRSGRVVGRIEPATVLLGPDGPWLISADGEGDPPSDVFSLATVLWFAATGRLPHDPGDPADLSDALRGPLAAGLDPSAAQRPTAAAVAAWLAAPDPGAGWLPADVAALTPVLPPHAAAVPTSGAAAPTVTGPSARSDDIGTTPTPPPSRGTDAGPGTSGAEPAPDDVRDRRVSRRTLLIGAGVAGVAAVAAYPAWSLLSGLGDPAELWTAAYSGYAMSLIIDGDLVLIGAHNGGTESEGVVALDAVTGGVRWQWSAPPGSENEYVTGGGRLSITVRDGLVVVGGPDLVTAFTAATGAVAWTRTVPLPRYRPLTNRDQARVVAVGPDTVLTLRRDGIDAFSATDGRARWTAGGDYTTTVPPVVAGGLCMVAGGGLEAVDLATGRPVWQRYDVHPSGLVAGTTDGTTVYQATDEGISAVDVATGALRWTAEMDLDSAPQQQLTLARGRVLTVAAGKPVALDSGTGRQVWSGPRLTGVTGQRIAAAENTVWLGTDDHVIAAFDAATGAPTWSAPPQPGLPDILAVAAVPGLVVQVSSSATVVAYRT